MYKNDLLEQTYVATYQFFIIQNISINVLIIVNILNVAERIKGRKLIE